MTAFHELSPAGCVGLGCSWSMVTLHRATVSGIVMTDGELRGRAELHTFTQGNPLLPGALPEARRLLGPGTRDFEGSVRIFEFANLSYLYTEHGFSSCRIGMTAALARQMVSTSP